MIRAIVLLGASLVLVAPDLSVGQSIDVRHAVQQYGDRSVLGDLAQRRIGAQELEVRVWGAVREDIRAVVLRRNGAQWSGMKVEHYACRAPIPGELYDQVELEDCSFHGTEFDDLCQMHQITDRVMEYARAVNVADCVPDRELIPFSWTVDTLVAAPLPGDTDFESLWRAMEGIAWQDLHEVGIGDNLSREGWWSHTSPWVVEWRNEDSYSVVQVLQCIKCNPSDPRFRMSQLIAVIEEYTGVVLSTRASRRE